MQNMSYERFSLLAFDGAFRSRGRLFRSDQPQPISRLLREFSIANPARATARDTTTKSNPRRRMNTDQCGFTGASNPATLTPRWPDVLAPEAVFSAGLVSRRHKSKRVGAAPIPGGAGNRLELKKVQWNVIATARCGPSDRLIGAMVQATSRHTSACSALW